MANFRTCVICKSNCTKYAAKKVTDKVNELTDDMKILRRHGLYWICNSCNEEKGKTPNTDKKVNLKKIEYNDKHIFVPLCGENYDEIEYDVNENTNILLPFSNQAVEVVQFESARSRVQEVAGLYEFREKTFDDLLKIYENELHKYIMAKDVL